MNVNKNYFNLVDEYLFKEVSERANRFKKANPEREVIKLGIGDVTLPLAKCVVDAMTTACQEMGESSTFRGYGEYQGYDFLRESICAYYLKRKVTLDINDIFVGEGAKSDLGQILDIFSSDNLVLIPNPVYPVYVDTNVMSARRISFMDGREENGFLPMPDYKVDADIIYLCSPNNPTGAVYNKAQLKEWVDYAISKKAVILFDAAYEAFVANSDLPRSIYEIEGAKKCCIEFCSLSKTAGFTGVRCGYTVVPKSLEFDGANLNAMWLRRQSTKYNGLSYIVQCGAAAVFSTEGLKETGENIEYYRQNARIISSALDQLGVWYTGGINSPYIWLKCVGGLNSWQFFDFLLSSAGVVGTPGAGFGSNGEGYFRLTAFNDQTSTKKAVANITKALKTIL